MKRILALLISLLIVLPWCASAVAPVSLAAEITEEDWTNDNILYVWTKKEFSGRHFLAEDFPEVRVKEILAVTKHFDGSVRLLLLLDRSVQTAAQAAETLVNNSFVDEIDFCADLPFNTVFELNSRDISLKVGESFVLEKVRFDAYYPQFDYQYISIRVLEEKYDRNKTYTVEDFPEFPAKSVTKTGPDQGIFTLEIENKGFVHFMRALDAFIKGEYQNVSFSRITAGFRPSFLETATDSQAVSLEEIDGNHIKIIAKKPGQAQVNVTYGTGANSASAVCIVRVVENNTWVFVLAGGVAALLALGTVWFLRKRRSIKSRA